MVEATVADVHCSAVAKEVGFKSELDGGVWGWMEQKIADEVRLFSEFTDWHQQISREKYCQAIQ